MFSKHRIEALSDGVFAIAMTLLILDIKVPAGVARGELGAAIAKDAHGWISFVITFGIACVFWALQHRVLDLLDNVSHQMLVPSFVFLGLVSVLPFSTSLWGHHINEPLALLIYFGNQFAIAAALTAKLEIARVHGHLHAGIAAEMMRFRLYAISVIMLSAAVSTYLLPLQWIWPVPLVFGLIGRILRRRKERSLAKRDRSHGKEASKRTYTEPSSR